MATKKTKEKITQNFNSFLKDNKELFDDPNTDDFYKKSIISHVNNILTTVNQTEYELFIPLVVTVAARYSNIFNNIPDKNYILNQLGNIIQEQEELVVNILCTELKYAIHKEKTSTGHITAFIDQLDNTTEPTQPQSNHIKQKVIVRLLDGGYNDIFINQLTSILFFDKFYSDNTYSTYKPNTPAATMADNIIHISEWLKSNTQHISILNKISIFNSTRTHSKKQVVVSSKAEWLKDVFNDDKFLSNLLLENIANVRMHSFFADGKYSIKFPWNLFNGELYTELEYNNIKETVRNSVNHIYSIYSPVERNIFDKFDIPHHFATVKRVFDSLNEKIFGIIKQNFKEPLSAELVKIVTDESNNVLKARIKNGLLRTTELIAEGKSINILQIEDEEIYLNTLSKYLGDFIITPAEIIDCLYSSKKMSTEYIKSLNNKPSDQNNISIESDNTVELLENLKDTENKYPKHIIDKELDNTLVIPEEISNKSNLVAKVNLAQSVFAMPSKQARPRDFTLIKSLLNIIAAYVNNSNRLGNSLDLNWLKQKNDGINLEKLESMTDLYFLHESLQTRNVLLNKSSQIDVMTNPLIQLLKIISRQQNEIAYYLKNRTKFESNGIYDLISTIDTVFLNIANLDATTFFLMTPEGFLMTENSTKNMKDISIEAQKHLVNYFIQNVSQENLDIFLKDEKMKNAILKPQYQMFFSIVESAIMNKTIVVNTKENQVNLRKNLKI